MLINWFIFLLLHHQLQWSSFSAEEFCCTLFIHLWSDMSQDFSSSCTLSPSTLSIHSWLAELKVSLAVRVLILFWIVWIITSLWLYFCPCTFHTIVGHFVACCGIPNVEKYPEVPNWLHFYHQPQSLEGALQVAELSIWCDVLIQLLNERSFVWHEVDFSAKKLLYEI